jgi:hypothetical protein
MTLFSTLLVLSKQRKETGVKEMTGENRCGYFLNEYLDGVTKRISKEKAIEDDGLLEFCNNGTA